MERTTTGWPVPPIVTQHQINRHWKQKSLLPKKNKKE